MMTILDVAELTGLCWDTVKNLVKERLAKDYAHIRLKELRRLAIDEIYLGRKQKYLTLVIDQESGRIIWVGRGKAGEALHGFWRRLKASGAKIEAVAMDMSQAYARSVAQHLPGALIVFDRFHVMKLMNEKLDDLRRQLVREAESQDAKLAIKGTRWLLLYRRDHLPQSRARELEKALEMNRPWPPPICSRRNWHWHGSRAVGRRWLTSAAPGARRRSPAASPSWSAWRNRWPITPPGY
jgi:transposase